MRPSGLTLLEMMVVLLIASMAVTLGFQSLGQWQRANAAIAEVSGASQQVTLTEAWLEGSLRSLIPLKDAPFKGDARQLSGVAVQPVQSHQGGATEVQWQIQRDGNGVRLFLQEPDKPLFLPLPNVTDAAFAYLDAEGKTHDQWPPALGLHDHLPTAILLTQTLDNGYQRLWVAHITGALNPRFDPFEVDPYD